MLRHGYLRQPIELLATPIDSRKHRAKLCEVREVEMAARRTEMHKLQELVRLHRTGRGNRDVARELCMGPNTERRYRTALESAGLLAGDPSELPELEALKAAVLKSAP